MYYTNLIRYINSRFTYLLTKNSTDNKPSVTLLMNSFKSANNNVSVRTVGLYTILIKRSLVINYTRTVNL